MVLAAGLGAAGAAPAISEPPAAVSQNEALTLSLWLRRAEQGGAEAQYTVGYMYATGKGAQLDYIEAGKWFRLAAAQDHPRAQWAIGLLYDNGWGVTKDKVEAFRWFRLAAEKGVCDPTGIQRIHRNVPGLPNFNIAIESDADHGD